MYHELIHVNTYCEIANGRFHPGLTRYNHPEGFSNLVYEANTLSVAVLPEDANILEYIETHDFLSLGYKSRKDYSIDYRQLPNRKYEIEIRPNKMYQLEDAIDIPQYETPKCVSFFEFMGDEFERIKLRAEWVLVYSNDEKALMIYANRQLQKSKKLFADAKRELREIQLGTSRDNIYILFVLNLFVVRTIVFLQQMFSPYINPPLDSKERLLYEIFQELSLRKVFRLFRHCLAISPTVFRKSFIENTCVSDDIMPQAFSESSKTFLYSSKTIENTGTGQCEPIKLNGQVNVLVDIFTQLLEKYRTPEGPFIETTRENLEAFIVANFIDRNSKPLSSYTIHTLLKPYRIDKHIKQDSPKRIDLSGFFETDE